MSAPSPALELHVALGLRPKHELVSIVGGGGKSALLFALAERAPRDTRWVLTTTTRMFASQIALAKAHCTNDPIALAGALRAGESGLLVIGEVEGEKAVGVPRELPSQLLAHPSVDCVAIEADGSRRLPTKAPAEHEPVIANGTSAVVIVAGIDALEGTIAERAHRPERVAKLTGRAVGDRLRPADLAALLRHADGGLKGVPEGARATVLLNKVETAAQRDAARETAEHLLSGAGIDRVVIGALQAPGGLFETCGSG